MHPCLGKAGDVALRLIPQSGVETRHIIKRDKKLFYFSEKEAVTMLCSTGSPIVDKSLWGFPSGACSSEKKT